MRLTTNVRKSTIAPHSPPHTCPSPADLLQLRSCIDISVSLFESLLHRKFLLVSLKLVSERATLKEGLFWLTVSEAVLLRKEVWQSRAEQVRSSGGGLGSRRRMPEHHVSSFTEVYSGE